MPNWTLKQLESFVWVAKLGSFRGTAERLNTTQPNISVRISQLEASLGVRLFYRDSGSVALTPIGHSLLVHAEKVLLASEEFSQQSIRSDQQAGILRLGVAELIAQTWLRDYLLDLRQVFPNVDVELKVDLTINLREELVSRALDLCLLNGPISNFNITNVDLGSVPYLWVASPQLGLAGADIATMTSHTILTHARNTRHFVELSAHFRDSWEGPVRIVPSSSLAANLQMTIDGLGIAPMSRTLVEKHLDSGELVEFPYEWKPSALVFTASYAHTPASFLLKRAAELARDRAARHHRGNIVGQPANPTDKDPLSNSIDNNNSTT
jgi:DNA-binding transcriptional LysR family regulator